MKLLVNVSRDHRGYVIWCPTLPGCMARGQSVQDARKLLEDALHGYVASLGGVPPRELHIEYQAPPAVMAA